MPGENPQRGCKMCNRTLIPSNSDYVLPSNGQYCNWKCNDGYFSPLTLKECRKCMQINNTNCRAGIQPSLCTSNQDATCTQKCIDDTKPLLNSRSVHTFHTTSWAHPVLDLDDTKKSHFAFKFLVPQVDTKYSHCNQLSMGMPGWTWSRNFAIETRIL